MAPEYIGVWMAPGWSQILRQPIEAGLADSTDNPPDPKKKLSGASTCAMETHD
jgi:hypothetical protein